MVITLGNLQIDFARRIFGRRTQAEIGASDTTSLLLGRMIEHETFSVMIREIFRRIAFWRSADRIGPDIPWTHWQLFFPVLMRSLCERKLRRFGAHAEVRPGAYLVVCSQISLGSRVIIRPLTMLQGDPQSDGKILIGGDFTSYNGVAQQQYLARLNANGSLEI